MSDMSSAHSVEEVDCTLEGNWASLWEEQMHVGKPMGGLGEDVLHLEANHSTCSSTGVYSQEPHSHFRNTKLQTFSGTEMMCVCEGLHTRSLCKNTGVYSPSSSTSSSPPPSPPLLLLLPLLLFSSSPPPSLLLPLFLLIPSPGHKGTIRALAVADSEHYFVSGSKDKTVRIWSLRNHGDGSASVASRYASTSTNSFDGIKSPFPHLPFLPIHTHARAHTHTHSRYTYTGHQKSVSAVELLEPMDSILSCDGTVHVSTHTAA